MEQKRTRSGKIVGRRVRKLGPDGFAGESCRSTGRVTRGSVAAVTLATATPTFSPDGLKRQNKTRPNGFAVEGMGICSAQNLSSDGRGKALPPSWPPRGQ